MNEQGGEEELGLHNGDYIVNEASLKSEWTEARLVPPDVDNSGSIESEGAFASPVEQELQSHRDFLRGILQHNHPTTNEGCEDNLHGLSISDATKGPEFPTTEDILNRITSHQHGAIAAADVLSNFDQSCHIADHHERPHVSSQSDPPVNLLQNAPDGAMNLSQTNNPSTISATTDPVWVTRLDIPQPCNDHNKLETEQIFGTEAISPETTADKLAADTANKPATNTFNASAVERQNSHISEAAMSAILEIPGPCEAEDLIEGIIFSASYLGTTQLPVSRNGMKNSRMMQAQEALNRIKVADGESQPSVLVDLFISTSKIKILDADNQQSMMSHSLRSISYVADISDLLVIMAKPQLTDDSETPENDGHSNKDTQRRSKVICHVLSSTDSHLISEAVGQSFSIAYQQFLLKNSIEPQNLSQSDFSQFLETQDMYHDDLLHYSKEENTKEIWVEKKSGENMGIAIVESGWGSIIPTVILANLQHGSPVERCGKFSIGDQIMSINGTSLVGLPLQTCHSIIKSLKSQTQVRFNIVSCPPVVSVLIKRLSLEHQLGFSVQNGVICSLIRGGIAERGGVRVGHRIIEINHRSVVATPHDKIVQMLVTSVGEIQMKTMPSSMYRLLTGQEQPIFM